MRNVKTKFAGTNINSFSSSDIITLLRDGLCPEDEDDPESTLDPNKKDCFGIDEDGFSFDKRRYPLYQCKNNCPGGENIFHLKTHFLFNNFSEFSYCCYWSGSHSHRSSGSCITPCCITPRWIIWSW